MPKTDVQNSYNNPKIAAVPREWVLPPQMPYSNIRPSHRTVRPTVVVQRNRPRYKVLANVGAAQSQPAVIAGSNGRYNQQIPSYGASNSPPQKDSNPSVGNGTVQQPVASAPRPQTSPMMSTIQENNQTTHFMIPPTGHQLLLNNYPALSPIYTMIENSKEETVTPPTSISARINNVHSYQTPTSLPVTSIPVQKPPPIPPRTAEFQRKNNSLEREIRKFDFAPVISQPKNPPDIISVLANPKATQTRIATVSGTVESYVQPLVHQTQQIQASSPKFKPSANGAFKPPPPRVKNKLKDRASQFQSGRSPTPTTVPYTVSASQSMWSSALDNKKRCSPPNKDLKSHSGGDNSSLEDFANELGHSSQDSANEEYIEKVMSQEAQRAPYDVKLKGHHANPADDPLVQHIPPIHARYQNPVPRNASVVDPPIKDPTKQV